MSKISDKMAISIFRALQNGKEVIAWKGKKQYKVTYARSIHGQGLVCGYESMDTGDRGEMTFDSKEIDIYD